MKFSTRLAALVFVLLFLPPGTSGAVTRGEFAAKLFDALGYAPASELYLPPDVQKFHAYAGQIGSAARYGLLPRTEFMPDADIDRHGAVQMALFMMGWGFEASLYELLNALPDFSSSGDSVFFLAAEMNPPAPSALLIDGAIPLSGTGDASIINWVKGCRKAVSWNRVFTFGGTDFIIYKQGVAKVGDRRQSPADMPANVNPIGAPGNNPLYVAAVAVHMNEADTRISFSSSLGAPRSPLSAFAYAYDATAAVNGGFFAESRPLGSMLFNGHPAGKPLEGRSAIGWNNEDGAFAFGSGFGRFGVRAPGGFVQFDRFNVAPQMHEASFFPSGVMTAAAGTALDAIELAVRDGHVMEKREGSWGNHFLPDGGSLIVARGNSRALLEGYGQGDAISIAADWDAGVFSESTHLIQAGPMLVRGNQPVAGNETFKADITDKRHPRTIAGTDGSRMIWAVIDGRNSAHSLGATMDETRWVARALGMSAAINMDGGGSSELIWRGIIANLPSDGKERPLPYAVLVTPKGASMTQKALEPQKNSWRAAPGYEGSVIPEGAPSDGAPYADTYNPYGAGN